MKYLILLRREEPAFPLLFAGHLSHADIAEIFRADGFAVLSGGFVKFEADGGATTHGESVSLHVRPRAHDAHLLAAFYRVTLASVGVAIPTPAPEPIVAPVFCPGCPVAQS